MKKFLLLCAVAFTLTGCATLLTGTSDTIYFNSFPEGAIVYKDGYELCQTPCRASIDRSFNETVIEYRLDGYQTRLFTLDTEFNVVSILNLGNMLGWAIDVASGAIFKYDRRVYDIDMRRYVPMVMEHPKEIHINTSDNTVDIYVVQAK